MSADLYAAPQHVGPTHVAQVAPEAILEALRARSMQDPASELRRIPFPRTWVNSGARGRPMPQPSGTSSLNDPGLLLVLVDPVDASVGALEVPIGVVHILDASDLAQKLASGRRQVL
jgi:hypothetical protein